MYRACTAYIPAMDLAYNCLLSYDMKRILTIYQVLTSFYIFDLMLFGIGIPKCAR